MPLLRLPRLVPEVVGCDPFVPRDLARVVGGASERRASTPYVFPSSPSGRMSGHASQIRFSRLGQARGASPGSLPAQVAPGGRLAHDSAPHSTAPRYYRVSIVDPQRLLFCRWSRQTPAGSAPPPPSPPPGRRRPRRSIRRVARPTGRCSPLLAPHPATPSCRRRGTHLRRRPDSVDSHPSAWLVPSRPAGDAHSLLG